MPCQLMKQQGDSETPRSTSPLVQGEITQGLSHVSPLYMEIVGSRESDHLKTSKVKMIPVLSKNVYIWLT